MKQGLLSGGLLFEIPLEDFGVELGRIDLLFAVCRINMLENPLTRLPLVPVGFADLDQRPLALLFPAYEHEGANRMVRSRIQENWMFGTTRTGIWILLQNSIHRWIR